MQNQQGTVKSSELIASHGDIHASLSVGIPSVKILSQETEALERIQQGLRHMDSVYF